jgi:hypothetical protein
MIPREPTRCDPATAHGGWTHPRPPAVHNEAAMQRRSSVALIAIVAVLAVILPACGSEEASVPPAQSVASETSPSSDLAPAGPMIEGEPACVPPGNGHARICGLGPPHRRVQGGSAYKVTTVTGEGFWVVLPDELAPASGVVAVPGVPIDVQAHLTTASPRDAADRYCGSFRTCEPVIVDREAVPAGVLTRWDDASGMIRDLGVTTVDFGPWTLVIPLLDAGPAERIARELTGNVGEDRYPRLDSTDPEVPVHTDWAEVVLWVPNPQTEGEHHLIRVLPGCELPAREQGLESFDAGPDLQLVNIGYVGGPQREPVPIEAGRWCVDSRYGVEVSDAERPRLELFHAKLRMVPSVG